MQRSNHDRRRPNLSITEPLLDEECFGPMVAIRAAMVPSGATVFGEKGIGKRRVRRRPVRYAPLTSRDTRGLAAPPRSTNDFRRAHTNSDGGKIEYPNRLTAHTLRCPTCGQLKRRQSSTAGGKTDPFATSDCFTKWSPRPQTAPVQRKIQILDMAKPASAVPVCIPYDHWSQPRAVILDPEDPFRKSHTDSGRSDRQKSSETWTGSTSPVSAIGPPPCSASFTPNRCHGYWLILLPRSPRDRVFSHWRSNAQIPLSSACSPRRVFWPGDLCLACGFKHHAIRRQRRGSVKGGLSTLETMDTGLRGRVSCSRRPKTGLIAHRLWFIRLHDVSAARVLYRSVCLSDALVCS